MLKDSYRRPIEREGLVTKTILESLPPEAQITTARFEGPNIALYTKNPKFSLTELTYHLSSLSRSLKKRFVVRTDPSIRMPEDETREAISKLLPKEIVVSAVFCDEATGEVVREVNRPEVIDAEMVIKIAQSTGWISHTRLSPHIPSTSISTIHSTLKGSAKERTNFLQELGKKIFRPPLLLRHRNTDTYSPGGDSFNQNSKFAKVNEGKIGYRHYSREEVILFCLGGVKQVGRSCFIVMTPESKVMLDCGINPAEPEPLSAFPRLDWFNFNFDELDAVVISHAHIDHQGFLPTLFKHGYNGPVYWY